MNLAKTAGVYTATKKDGTIYYRASFTYRRKHISLGSFATAQLANMAYNEAISLVETTKSGIYDYNSSCILSFDKWVSIINFRDNKLYIKNPIYLKSRFFIYYLSPSIELKFDVDDLFYYSNHKIMKRGGHLFVADYGMQVNIISRYGIKNFAVKGRDYEFANGDETDFRYGNIIIHNKYYGVTHTIKNGKDIYVAKIHINGDYIIGKYSTEIKAAIAYNKAADTLTNAGLNKNYNLNYIEDLSSIEYASLYNSIKISPKIRNYFT